MQQHYLNDGRRGRRMRKGTGRYGLWVPQKEASPSLNKWSKGHDHGQAIEVLVISSPIARNSPVRGHGWGMEWVTSLKSHTPTSTHPAWVLRLWNCRTQAGLTPAEQEDRDSGSLHLPGSSVGTAHSCFPLAGPMASRQEAVMRDPHSSTPPSPGQSFSASVGIVRLLPTEAEKLGGGGWRDRAGVV